MMSNNGATAVADVSGEKAVAETRAKVRFQVSKIDDTTASNQTAFSRVDSVFDTRNSDDFFDNSGPYEPIMHEDMPKVVISSAEGRKITIVKAQVKPQDDDRAYEGTPLYDPEGKDPELDLFESSRPNAAVGVVRALAGYNPMQPGTSESEKKARKIQGAKMGTVMGVFLPCIQNILGVLFFIRLAWIVGTAGVLQSFFIVLICCSVTFLTSISLSAIATNGMVPGGGPYYMISRNLGPELGGAVGILFYLGTTIAAAMYIVGAVEIFVLYLVPQAKIFSDISNCYRLYGTCFLMVLGIIVMGGVRVVSKFTLPTVSIVVLCIFLTFVGVFVNANGSDRLKFCMSGNRIVNMVQFEQDFPDLSIECTNASLSQAFCQYDNKTFQPQCDPYFEKHGVYQKNAIAGLMHGALANNFDSKFLYKDEVLAKETGDTEDHPSKYYVFSDITTSFIILIGVFFPSCTGIMAGSNRSGDLRDASVSIPRGTLAATIVTSSIYLAGVLLFGASVNEMFIRDKFGEGAYGKLVIAELAVPHPMMILIGCFLSTVGAGMQSLTGAPRLLQAIARDGVVPILSPLQITTKHGEPWMAILVTLGICEVGVLIAQMEKITALITQFFLMCYLGVNAACALQSLLRSPGWRPRFKYYHWSLSMLGATLCLAVMFMSHWIFALVAFIIGIVVYKYIEYRGAEKEWGDGLRGLGLSAARYALLNLEGRTPHTKNWRPQTLVLCKANKEERGISHPSLVAFVSQLKAGKGLTVIASVVEGDFTESSNKAEEVKEDLKELRDSFKIRGFCEVLVATSVSEGTASFIQTCGLGCLKHNTVILSWPDNWREQLENGQEDGWDKCHQFVDTVRVASSANCAILVPKNVDQFPTTEKMTGYMDVWWVVHDGGMLMLLPFLLRQHRIWKYSKLRIFTVAQPEDNSIKVKEDLVTFLYHLRISAEVDVIEVSGDEITEYTYERTLRMEQRYQILRELKLSGKEKSKEIQSAVYDKRKMSKIAEDQNFPPPLTSPIRDIPEVKFSMSDVDADVDSFRKDIPTIVTIPETPESKQKDDEDESNSKPIDGSLHLNLNSNGPTLNKDSGRSGSPGPGPLPSGLPYAGLKSSNVRRMNTAVRLNEAILSRSSESDLVIVNLPGPGKRGQSDQYYMEFIEALTENCKRVLLVKGTGAEVVTIYS